MLTFIADWPGDGRDCHEIRRGEGWSYEPDYYGLAGIAWTLLFGSHFEAEHTVLNTSGKGCSLVGKPFRRYHQQAIWTKLFRVLLDPTSIRNGELPVTAELTACRQEMEAWLSANCDRGGRTLKSLLKKLEIAQLSRQR